MSLFERFTLDFYDTVRFFIDPDKLTFDTLEKKRLINFKRYIRDDKLKDLEFDYDRCINELSLKSIDIFSDYLNAFLFDTIYSFIHYIRFIEKCFFYKNDDNSILYVEEIEKENKCILYYKPVANEFKLKIEFTESKIKTDTLFNTNLKFCKVTVVRTYGKQMQNVFNFVENEEIHLITEDIALMLNLSYKLCSRMRYIFDGILDDIVKNYTHITAIKDGYYIRPKAKDIIKHGAYIENGFWIRTNKL